MVDAPTVRGYTVNSTMPTQQAGDVILAFAFNVDSSTVPSFASGWTTIGSRTSSYGTAVAYKISDGSSTIGTLTNTTNCAVVTVSGASTKTTTGSSPSFLGGITSGGGSTDPTTISGVSYASAPSLLRLTAATFLGGGGNPITPTYSAGTKLATLQYFSGYTSMDLLSGTDYGNLTITAPPGYGFSSLSIISAQVLPPGLSSGFFAMF